MELKEWMAGAGYRLEQWHWETRIDNREKRERLSGEESHRTVGGGTQTKQLGKWGRLSEGVALEQLGEELGRTTGKAGTAIRGGVALEDSDEQLGKAGTAIRGQVVLEGSDGQLGK